MSGSTLTLEEIQELANAPEQVASRIVELLDAISFESNEDVHSWLCDCFEHVNIADVDLSTVATYCTCENSSAAMWACKLIGRDRSKTGIYQDILSKALLEHSDISVRQQAAFSLRNAIPHSEATR
ncbi:MAG: hypothetical protein AAF412_10760, partial [Pseudomonadota bacterium]